MVSGLKIQKMYQAPSMNLKVYFSINVFRRQIHIIISSIFVYVIINQK